MSLLVSTISIHTPKNTCNTLMQRVHCLYAQIWSLHFEIVKPAETRDLPEEHANALYLKFGGRDEPETQFRPHSRSTKYCAPIQDAQACEDSSSIRASCRDLPNHNRQRCSRAQGGRDGGALTLNRFSCSSCLPLTAP